MTPRQADVAFVLEGVPGVRGVFALTPSSAAADFDFAIEMEGSLANVAQAHYMLLRALTHEECARVLWFRADRAPPAYSGRLLPLSLTSSERSDARARVRPIEPFSLPVAARGPHDTCALVIDSDATAIAAIRREFHAHVRVETMPHIARTLAGSNAFDVIFCDVERLFKSVPASSYERVIVTATQERWPMSTGSVLPPKRWLRKPFTPSELAACVNDVLPARPSPRQESPLASKPRALPPALHRASSADALRVLLVDVEGGIRDAVASAFGDGGAAGIIVAYGEDAVERALANSFHLVFCSVSSALAADGFLARLRLRRATNRGQVIVLVPEVDVDFARGALPENRIVALPVDEALLRGLVGLAARTTVERAAVAELPANPPGVAEVPRYRRLAVLVVDDELETQILFAAGAPSDEADIALAKTSLEAFTHVVERPVDVLVISAAMRSDGAEPFYRVLWRMKPELKARTVLVTGLADVSASPRVVRRPLSRAALAAIVARGS